MVSAIERYQAKLIGDSVEGAGRCYSDRPEEPGRDSGGASPEAAGVLPSSIVLQSHQMVPVLAVPRPSRGQALANQRLID